MTLQTAQRPRRASDDAGLRPVTSADLPAALLLSRAVGWGHRLCDWELQLSIGRGFVAENASGVVAIALWWPFESDRGTVGMVIVSPSCQRQGLGRRLMEAVLEDAGDRTLFLNATEAGLPLYLDLGFVEVGGLCQHQGEVAARGPVAGPDDRGGTPSGARLRPLDPRDRDAVVALDAAAYGASRAALIDALIGVGHGVVIERDGGLSGIALRRASGRGVVIGPVHAQDDADAALLVDAMRADVEGFLRIDIQADVPGFAAHLEALGLARVSAVTTMARPAPTPPRSALGTPRCFALASQAFG